jgi:hypothetical protein
MKTWLIVSNKSETNIYNVNWKKDSLRVVETFNNENGRLKEGELISDGPGFTRTSSTKGARAFVREKVAVIHATEIYIKKLTSYLTLAKNKNEYDNLVVMAEPGHLGILRQNLERANLNIEKIINSDYSHLKKHELEKKFYGNLDESIRGETHYQ